MNDLHRFYQDVNELLMPNTNSWNVELLNNLFDQATSKQIQEIFMDTTKEDVMIWSPSRDGKFSVKSAYKLLTMPNTNIQINGRAIQPAVWKSLWQCNVAHRVKLFTWKSIHNIHSTKDKLALFQDSPDTQCGFCGAHYETIEHLLMECNFSKSVWQKLNINIDAERSRFDSVSLWVENWFTSNMGTTNNTRLLTLLIGSWILWKERCDAIFQGVSLNPHNTVHRVNYYLSVHSCNSSLHYSIPMHDSSSSQIAVSRWKPPSQGTFKLNVDASFCHDSKQLGTGIILRDCAGTCQGIQGHYSDGALSPENGECKAIREAIIWAKELQLSRIHVEADAKLVIQSLLENSLLIQWENRNLLKEIRHLSSSFDYCKFSFVSRDDNQVADARVTASNISHLSDFPSELCELLARDIIPLAT